MQIETGVGPQSPNAPGGPKMRGLGDGTVGTADAHGRYLEAVYRNAVYWCSTGSAGITLAAANATPLAAGTGKPVVGVLNPTGSGKIAYLWFLLYQHVSGTPAAGAWVWNYVYGITSITAGTSAPTSILTGQSQGSAMLALVNAATTGSLAGIAGPLAPVNQPFAGALAAGAGILGEQKELAGYMPVFPGQAVALAAPGAGTSHVFAASLIWEEAPLNFG